MGVTIEEQKQAIRDSDIEPAYAPEVHRLATRLGWFGETRSKTHVLELIDRGWVKVVVSPNGLYVQATPAGLVELGE